MVVPGSGPTADDAAALEPHHTHVLLVPGASWGDESPWLTRVADALADGTGWLTVVINGGDITYADAAASLAPRTAGGGPLRHGTHRRRDRDRARRTGRRSAGRGRRRVAATQIVAVDDVARVHDVVDSLLS